MGVDLREHGLKSRAASGTRSVERLCGTLMI